MRYTRSEALTIMIYELDNDRLGAMESRGSACVYDDGKGKHCIVGCLLDKNQLAQIHNRDLNENAPVEYLADNGIIYPYHWGFTLEQLKFLQGWHDSWARGDVTTALLRDILTAIKDADSPLKLAQAYTVRNMIFGININFGSLPTHQEF